MPRLRNRLQTVVFRRHRHILRQGRTSRLAAEQHQAVCHGGVPGKHRPLFCAHHADITVRKASAADVERQDDASIKRSRRKARVRHGDPVASRTDFRRVRIDEIIERQILYLIIQFGVPAVCHLAEADFHLVFIHLGHFVFHRGENGGKRPILRKGLVRVQNRIDVGLSEKQRRIAERHFCRAVPQDQSHADIFELGAGFNAAFLRQIRPDKPVIGRQRSARCRIKPLYGRWRNGEGIDGRTCHVEGDI